MKNTSKHLIIWTLIALTLTGCAMFRNPTKNQDKIEKKVGAIQEVKDLTAKNTDKTVGQIQSLSFGVSYALNKTEDTNAPVNIAKELNTRVLSLSGMPSVSEINFMKHLVDDLTSQLDAERVRGESALAAKDKELINLQKIKVDLSNQLIKKQTELGIAAEAVSKGADKDANQLAEMNRFFGLGAILYGIKRFVTSSLIAILVFVVIFFVLRVAASTNPIAKAVFGIFETVAGFAVNCIRGLIPGVVSASKLVPQVQYDEYKSTLCKMIDVIQDLKSTEEKTGEAVSLKSIRQEFSIRLNDSEKELIRKCKKDLNWG